MARDKTARESDDGRTVDRRSFLGVAGAGVASALGVGALSGAATAADYDTVTVSAGEQRTFNVGSGETLENLLIDMTADGASAKIITSGSGWTVRNVAFKGNHPGGHYLMTPGVTSEDGEGLIENVYMGDGQTERTTKGGVWVRNGHRGTITFRNVNMQHFIDNGLYGTDPGYDSKGGVVHVEDSYFNSNNIANIRVGSIDGRTCHVRNCVVEVGSTRPLGRSGGAINSRGVWAWWGPVEVHDSDIEGTAREHTQRAGNPSITSNNTRWGSDANTDRRPDGVPLSAEEAASGTSSAGGGSGGNGGSGGSGDGDSSDGSDEETTTETGDGEGTVLELIAGSNASNESYEFTVAGSVTKRTNADDVSAESSDTVTDNGDGTMTVTVSGVAGNGYGDSYRVDGDVVSMDLDESQWTLRWGGEEVAVEDLVLPNKLVIDGSNRPRVASTYTFTVSGQARKSAALGTVNARDTIEDGEISGRVIGGTDGFRFSGEITGFSLDGPANVRVENGS